jgi:hypothetical protein
MSCCWSDVPSARRQTALHMRRSGLWSRSRVAYPAAESRDLTLSALGEAAIWILGLADQCEPNSAKRTTSPQTTAATIQSGRIPIDDALLAAG